MFAYIKSGETNHQKGQGQQETLEVGYLGGCRNLFFTFVYLFWQRRGRSRFQISDLASPDFTKLTF
jgi:hypothetical protein